MDCRRRILSGLALALLAVFCIFAGVVPVALAVLILSSVALSEFYELMKLPSFLRGFGFLWNTVLLFLVFAHTGELSGMPSIQTSFLWIPLVALFSFHFFGHFIGQADSLENSLRYKSGVLLIGFLWISQTLALAILIRAMPRGLEWLFLALAAAALCDIGAYATGKIFGKHKLAPTLSPGKTYEGLAGGILFSVVGTLIVGQWLSIPWGARAFLGIFLALAAVAGDLLESAWKRKIGVKDSGRIVPGHGGILDRIDSHLLTLPALYLYLLF